MSAGEAGPKKEHRRWAFPLKALVRVVAEYHKGETGRVKGRGVFRGAGEEFYEIVDSLGEQVGKAVFTPQQLERVKSKPASDPDWGYIKKALKRGGVSACLRAVDRVIARNPGMLDWERRSLEDFKTALVRSPATSSS